MEKDNEARRDDERDASLERQTLDRRRWLEETPGQMRARIYGRAYRLTEDPANAA